MEAFRKPKIQLLYFCICGFSKKSATTATIRTREDTEYRREKGAPSGKRVLRKKTRFAHKDDRNRRRILFTVELSANAGNTKLDKRTTQKRISIDAENKNGRHAEEREERRAR